MNDRSSDEDIFFAALEKAEPAERATYLGEACAGNESLRHRVEAMLAAHPQVGQFLERPIAEAEGVAELGAVQNAAADLSFLSPSSEPGSLGRLDHYEVLEVVGRGGTGVVLRARDTKLQRVVALKVLAAPLAASGSARQRFAREARAAAAVRDDHVIDIHAVRDDGPLPYLVMEFIDGCTLATLLRKGGPLEVKEVLRIGMQVASGLAAAHRHGLIHRDVKPANILLENGVQRVKLTDFGLARAADDASLTQTGFIAGTPLYMAPEQAAGEPIDTRADLFGLGSVLYELCTGRPAFRALTTVAVIRRVCEDTPRPIREVSPDIPEALCRVIERLHAKKPAERLASALEVADELAKVLADKCDPRAHHLSEPRARRGRCKWLWAAAALLLLVAGLGMSEATGVTDVRCTVIRLRSPEGTLVVEVDKAANQRGALGTAAKAALDEEQAPFRRAAVKRIGTLDVRWWPEVEIDLIVSLRFDRNESVRLEAALALAQGHCCTKKTRAALQIAADGSDKDGSPAETSARVQKAAREALKVCDFKLNHKTASVVGAGRTR
jgi:hypothetical protein